MVVRHRGATPAPRDSSPPTAAAAPGLRASASRKGRVFTIEEVREHSAPDDCYVVVDNKVLDVTAWAAKHPGGRMTLLSLGGRDATDMFNGFHPEAVRKQLGAFQVGTLEGYEPDALTRDFRAIREQLIAEGQFDTAAWYYAVKAVWCASLLAAAVYLTVTGSSAEGVTGRQLLGAALLGFFWHQLAFVGHDIGHNAVTHKRSIDMGLLGPLCGNLLGGVSMGWWKRSHNVHHVLTNSRTHDPDIQHLPVMALSPTFFDGIYSQFHGRVMDFDALGKWFVSHQHILYYPIMAVARFNLYVQSILHILDLKKRLTPAEMGDRSVEALGIAGFWAGITWLLSHVGGSAWGCVGYLFLANGVAGMVHVQILISHLIMETYDGVRYTSDDEGFLKTQLATTADVGCPRWMDWFHGGLQFQLEHHLFPRLPRHNLRRARELVMALCEKHSIPRVEVGFYKANTMCLSTLKKAADVAKALPAGKVKPFSSFLWEGVNAQG